IFTLSSRSIIFGKSSLTASVIVLLSSTDFFRSSMDFLLDFSVIDLINTLKFFNDNDLAASIKSKLDMGTIPNKP
ncbi:hypothetical protein ACJMK2_028796, partial [Sinanodonta woodiana]